MALVQNYPVTYHKYEVNLPTSIWHEQYAEIIAWLRDNFGPYNDGELWDIVTQGVLREVPVRFYYEHHATAFKLVWL